jgi:4-hydroxy-2-oxoheptanedioate aldolase
VQVETRAGMEAIEAIAAVDGVDGLFVGPSDLAASLRHPGDIRHPDMVAAVEQAITRIVAAGKPAGVLYLDPADARRCMALGTTFTAVGVDLGVLLRGAEALAADFRVPG